MRVTPIALYSTNTLLAYRINQKYYGQKHYVWCNSSLRGDNSPPDNSNPPSSSPIEIYRDFDKAVKEGDHNSFLISANKLGIRNGAQKKCDAGTITDSDLTEINWIVDSAQIPDFKPLLYLIPYSNLIANIITPVPPQTKAHPFSDECIIESLERAYFDILNLSLG